MKRQRWWMFVGVVLAMGVAACAGTSQMNRENVPSEDPVIGLLSKGITQLNVNINVLSKRMSDVQAASKETDPALQELQTLDLTGWQLHQQQWILQRDHLVLARDLLQQANKSREEKERLLDEWRKHRQEYVQAIGELRQQRQGLENKHMEVEARLVERRLQ